MNEGTDQQIGSENSKVLEAQSLSIRNISMLEEKEIEDEENDGICNYQEQIQSTLEAREELCWRI